MVSPSFCVLSNFACVCLFYQLPREGDLSFLPWLGLVCFFLGLSYESGFSGETEPMGSIEIYIKGCIIKTGSCGYGSWEAPGSAVCKLENQGSWGLTPSLKAKGLITREGAMGLRGVAGVGLRVWRPESQDLHPMSENRKRWAAWLQKREFKSPTA